MNSSPEEKSEPPQISWETRFEVVGNHLSAVSERQFVYGKWLLNWLVTLHAGSIIAISQAGDYKVKLYQACGDLLIWGIVASLVAGFCAWWNFTYAAQAYNHVRGEMLRGRPPIIPKRMQRIASVTMWLSLISGIASVLLFVLAAFRATQVLQ